MNIVILAAGAGQRMHSSWPKVLHPLAGRPLLGHVLKTARALKPTKLIVVVSQSQAVPRAVAAADIEWAVQAQPLGTAHALQQAFPRLQRSQPTLVLYGDVPLLRASTLTRLIKATGVSGYGILTANRTDPTGYGRIIRDRAGRVVRIVEQKDANESEQAIHEIHTGIVMMPTAHLADWLPSLTNRNAQREYYLTDLVERAVADGLEIVTVQPDEEGEILGVNTKAQLAAVERSHQRHLAEALLQAGVTLADPARLDIRGALKCGRDVSIDVNCVFEGQVTLGNGVSIGPNCVLKNTTVGPGAQIHAFTHIEEAQIGSYARVGPYARLRPGTTLAHETRVGNFVEIKNTTIGAGSQANHLTYLGDAEVGTHVNIGAGTITCNYDGANKHRTRIEDEVFVGSDTQLVAPVRLARGATIAAGTTVWKDVPARTLVLNKKIQVTKADYKRPKKKDRER